MNRTRQKTKSRQKLTESQKELAATMRRLRTGKPTRISRKPSSWDVA